MEKIDLKSGRLFPVHFLFFGGLLFFTAIGLLLTHPIWSVVIFFVSILIFTSTTGIEFNPDKKTYKPYNAFLYIKMGNASNYDEVEKIFINRSQVSQKIYTAHTAQSSTFKKEEFDAYIKFANGRKEYLLTDKNKERLINKLKPVADGLETSIIDNTIS